MRTTVRIDDHLLVELKALAAQSQRTLSEVIEQAARDMLARRKQASERPHVRLTTVSGHGPAPGLDLDDGASLLDIMEGH